MIRIENIMKPTNWLNSCLRFCDKGKSDEIRFFFKFSKPFSLEKNNSKFNLYSCFCVLALNFTVSNVGVNFNIIQVHGWNNVFSVGEFRVKIRTQNTCIHITEHSWPCQKSRKQQHINTSVILFLIVFSEFYLKVKKFVYF